MSELQDKVLLTPEEIVAVYAESRLAKLAESKKEFVTTEQWIAHIGFEEFKDATAEYRADTILAEAQKLMGELTNPDGTWKMTGANIVEVRKGLGMEVSA